MTEEEARKKIEDAIKLEYLLFPVIVASGDTIQVIQIITPQHICQ